MILNNVTKFHKILIKTILIRGQTSLGQTCIHTDGRTGVTLNVPAIVMAGHKKKLAIEFGNFWLGLSPPVKYFFTDRSKAVLLLWIILLFMSCFRYACLHVCLLLPCGHLQGKD